MACILILSPLNAKAATKRSLSLTITYKSTYDSNLLRYSNRDRDRFQDRSELFESPIRTLDDWRNDFKLSATWEHRFIKKLDTHLTGTVNFAQHAMNPIKNFGWFSVTVRQDMSGRFRAWLIYLHEPRYYIRDYSDIHTDERHHCEFALDQWKGKLSYRPVELVELIGFSEFKKYAYDEYFTEYDGDLNEFGVENILRSGSWRLSLGYSLTIFDNIGFENASLVLRETVNEDDEAGQGDYQQDSYQASVRYSFNLGQRRAYLQVESNLNDRYYSTDQDPEIDPFHHGRRDVVLTTGLVGYYSFSKIVGIKMGISRNTRDSRASAPVVTRVKDYSRLTGWIELSYQLR